MGSPFAAKTALTVPPDVFDFAHHLHALDNAEHLAGLNHITNLRKGRSLWIGRLIKPPPWALAPRFYQNSGLRSPLVVLDLLGGHRPRQWSV